MADLALQSGAARQRQLVARQGAGAAALGDTLFRHLTRVGRARRAGAARRRHRRAGHRRDAGACRRSASASLISERWNPVTEKFGALAPIYGTLVTSLIAMLIARAGRLRHRDLPDRAVPACAAAPARHRDRAARRHPQHHLRHLGPVRLRAVPAADTSSRPDRRRSATSRCCRSLFAGPPYGIGMLTAGLILAIMVLPFITSIMRDVFETVPPVLKEAAYGARLHHLGGRAERRAALHAGRRRRRHHARPRPRARRDHGGHLRDRQRAPDLAPRSSRPARRSRRRSPTSSPKRSASSTPRR